MINRPHRKREAGVAADLLQTANAALFARNWERAIENYREALDLNPENADAWSNLGAAFLEIGRAEEAELALQRARALTPDGIAVLGNLANLKKQLGENNAAEQFYRQILTHNPSIARAWHEMARVKRFRAGDPDIAAMKLLHAKSPPDGEDRMLAAYGLGKALEDTGDYNGAFEYLTEANLLKRKTVTFDVKAHHTAVDELIRVFNSSYINRFELGGYNDERPVFILGMPRSGTTLVEQVLASHESVFGGGEFEGLGQIIAASVPNFPTGATLLTPPNLKLIGQKYVRLLTKGTGNAPRVTDKMPRNFLFIGLIALVLPKARIVHCRRSPIDTCLSCFALHFPRGQEFSYDLEELGSYYKLYQRVMAHWHRVLPGRILDIAYEDVVSEPELKARELVEFCGLDWNNSCLEFHKTNRLVRTASAGQVREPVYTRSLARWRRFERHLAPLKEMLGEYTEEK